MGDIMLDVTYNGYNIVERDVGYGHVFDVLDLSGECIDEDFFEVSDAEWHIDNTLNQ